MLEGIELFDKGGELADKGRYEEAIECYDEFLKINPDDVDAWYNEGNLLEKMGRPKEAVKCYDEVTEIDSKHAIAWCNKGRALLSLGRSQEALECYDEATKQAMDLPPADLLAFGVEPGFPEAWAGKGICLFNLGQYGEALKCANEALKINPSDKFARDLKKRLANLVEGNVGMNNLNDTNIRRYRFSNPLPTTQETESSFVKNSKHDAGYGIEGAFELLMEATGRNSIEYYLKEAQKELKKIKSRTHDSAWQEFCTYWEELGGDDVAALRAAVRMYTTDNVYNHLNESWRSGKSMTFRGFSTLLRKSLKFVPYYMGSTVYRCVSIQDYENYQKGLVYRWPFFISASANEEQASKFGDILFTIKIPSIFSISEISEYSVCPREEEVLFHPYTRFEVVKKSKTQINVELCTRGSAFDWV